ncbi:hypothetical protein TrRE_jg9793 [Triparma retinervis]|uniref:Uncharacterized protein n=1 Tax=Triparma retinervis TaxID=2557542 RepID=A0A9W7L0W1_9STRA|nr:hypothetical protein TrRE_jg9793 [Triparma retinervis]
MKKFEDSSTWFKDLDPMVALEVREEMRRSSTAVDGFPVGSPVISRAMSPSSVGSTSSFRGSPSFLAPVLPREFEGEESELMEDNGDANFASKVDLFSLRMKSIIDEERETIGKEAYLEACKAYRTAPNIYFLDNLPRTHIDLNNYNCSPEAIMAMSCAMRFNTTLKFLDFTDNFMGDKAGETLIKALLENHSISTLVLAGNKLGKKTGKALADLLLSKTIRLSTINASKNELDDYSTTLLGASLDGKNKTVTSLDLSHNNITSNGASSIFRVLDRRHLVYLNMTGNKINVVESFGISRHLPDSLKEYKAMISDLPDLLISSVLKTLDLSLTNLGNPIAKIIAQVVSDDTTCLASVNLSFCQIEKEGGIALAKGIMGNTTLTKLHLRGNSMGFDCLLTFINALPSCPSLTLLDLRDCMLDAKRDLTADPLVKRNYGGVSKEMVEKALIKQEEFHKIQEEMMAVNGGGLIGKKGKKGKGGKKNGGKKGKKGKGSGVDLSSIPKKFFDMVVQDAIREKEELAAPPPPVPEASSAKADPKSKKRASVAKVAKAKPVPLELEVAANPVSWQLPMDALTKTKTILEPEDRLAILQHHITKINNVRSGNECEILFDQKLYY